MKRLMASKGLLALLLGSSGSGAMASYNYFEQYGYEPQLQRCVDLLRPAVTGSPGDQVRFEVEEIKLRGPWFRFEISTTVRDQTGRVRLNDYKVGCKANRWVAKTRLIRRPNQTAAAPLQLELLGRN